MAELSLIGLGIFAVLFMLALALVSNTSSTGQTSIQRQMFLINCPEPSYDGQYNASNVTIDGFSVVLGTDDASTPYLNNVTYGGIGTVFRCNIDGLSSGIGQGVTMTNKDYQEVTLGFPSGWFKFAGDFIGALFQRINNFFYLITFFVTPTNFNILGYDINDLSSIALAFVIAIYAICYVAIGAMMYKIISPFSSVA